MTSTSSPKDHAEGNAAVETFVHVLAPASGADDVRNLEKVNRIKGWETGRRFQIYPPARIQLGFMTHPIRWSDSVDSLGTKPPENVTITAQEPAIPNDSDDIRDRADVPDSPSQIPDSQPGSSNELDIQSELDISSAEFLAVLATCENPAPVQSSPPEVLPRIARSPRTSSLRPLNTTPNQSPASTEHSVPSDCHPEKYLIFTSTPKSKPLKGFLSSIERRGVTYPKPKVISDDIQLIPRDLATLFPISLFRCKSQSRELLDLERGFWRIDLSSWPETEKLDFWTRMKKAIEGGRFGWINMLFDAYQEDVLNIFCFGGAAKHVWVLLYVMSTKRTKYGLQYFDSSEQLVIEGTASP